MTQGPNKARRVADTLHRRVAKHVEAQVALSWAGSGTTDDRITIEASAEKAKNALSLEVQATAALLDRTEKHNAELVQQLKQTRDWVEAHSFDGAAKAAMLAACDEVLQKVSL